MRSPGVFDPSHGHGEFEQLHTRGEHEPRRIPPLLWEDAGAVAGAGRGRWTVRVFVAGAGIVDRIGQGGGTGLRPTGLR
jgi:hypothetical protein